METAIALSNLSFSIVLAQANKPNLPNLGTCDRALC